VNCERLRIRIGAFVVFPDCHERRLVLASKRHWTTIVGQAAAHPAAFGLVLLYALLWLVLDRPSFNWNAVATLAMWIMPLFIQRANRRDTLALHAKLDELLRANQHARSELTRLDEQDPEVIQQLRGLELRGDRAIRSKRHCLSRP
jgi:low affinity Fe/Cu permease